MEQIAIISDIHGNAPALESVIDEIQRREIKKIFCLGDIIVKGPSSDDEKYSFKNDRIFYNVD